MNNEQQRNRDYQRRDADDAMVAAENRRNDAVGSGDAERVAVCEWQVDDARRVCRAVNRD